MQTLQATHTTVMPLKLIEWSVFDRPTQYRVVDQDGVLIAKINGNEFVKVAEEMVNAFNDQEKIPEMKSLLRNRLIDICKQLGGAPGSIQYAIRTSIENKFDECLAMLKDQLRDAPVSLTSAIGGEAVQIVKVL